MKRFTPKRLLLTLSILLTAGILFNASSADAQRYRFTKIADTSTHYSFFPPVINEEGVVAFRAQRQSDGATGIFTGSGGAITTIADTRGNFASFAPPSINDHGTVAFQAQLDVGGFGVYAGNGSAAATTLYQSDSQFDVFGNVDINNSGNVAFAATVRSGGIGIFRGNGGAVTTIADNSGFLRGFESVGIDDNNNVAFVGVPRSGGEGIYKGDGNSLRTVATTTNPLVYNSFDMSSEGNLTFTFSPAAGSGRGTIYLEDEGALTTVASAPGTFSSLYGPSVNDSGTVLFQGSGSLGSGLFLARDNQFERVFTPGGFLFGSRVFDLAALRGLNNQGSFAFLALYQSGGVIVRADPVPEAGTAALFAAIGMVFATIRYRRRLAKPQV